MEAEFVRRVQSLENLQRSAGQLLSKFQQNLEMLRRPSLVESSAVIKGIVEMNRTLRMSRYIEAGCRHLRSDICSIAGLNNAMKALENHVTSVRACLNDLRQILDSALEAFFMVADEAEKLSSPREDGEDDSKRLDAMNSVTAMSLVYSMLEDDYKMQARIVDDLSLETRSSALDSYCTVWKLRPFVNEEVLAALVSPKPACKQKQ